MASGKTATAKAIGGIIHSDFVDLDVQIEVDEGKSISQNIRGIMGKIILGV